MFALGNEIKNTIQDIPGIADLNVEQQIERPQHAVGCREIDRFIGSKGKLV